MSGKPRVLSGMRPTGALHLGHLVGVLENWRQLQDHYDCFFMVADYHALMSEYEHPEQLRRWSAENVRDWLSAGIDPVRSVIFRQSDVPEHAELFLLLSMLVPLGWVERIPTYKEQLRELAGRDLTTYGFLGYPVLQAADILLYKAQAVPVGDDQLPHLEFTRELVRRLHALLKVELFPEPQALLTAAPRLSGTDGRKMSKSYHNTIPLEAHATEVRALVQDMFTDPERIKMSDPGHPDRCNVCGYWRVFAPAQAPRLAEECRSSQRGCVQNKRELAEALITVTERFRAAREHPPEGATGGATGGGVLRDVAQVFQDGARRARIIAQQTMHEIKSAFGLVSA